MTRRNKPFNDTGFAFMVFTILIVTATFVIGEIPANAEIETREQKSTLVDLRGVWRVTEQSTRSIGASWQADTTPYLSLYIFTEKHYSYMFTLGSTPRRLFAGDPNRPTDPEKVRAYESFVAGSGSYTLSGSVLTLSAILHKNPNEMKGESLRYIVELNVSRLVLTIVNPPWSPGREERTVLARVE